MGKIYNIPATVSFVDTLAERLLSDYAKNELALSDVLVLVANRREAGILKEAFIRKQGLKPTILPRIVPIGDLEEDEIFLTSENFDAALLPAISNTERLLLFTKIIVSKPSDFGLNEFSLAQAYSLAKELASLVDSVQNEQLDFADLDKLVPEEYSEHWQETLKFLRIITQYWPQILKERSFCDVAEKHNILLKLKAEQWQKENPKTHIVTAGVYTDYPAVKNLLKTIYGLQNGEIYIGGLDRNLDEDSWKNVKDNHPQYQLKRLLEYLEVAREDIPDCVKSQNPQREYFVSEVMRPAKNSDQWLNLRDKKFENDAIAGIRLMTCDNLREEALAIALIMREWIVEDEVTAALVSPDRNLARMAASELGRWGISVDDTAGVPLNLQPIAIYLRQIFAVAEQEFSALSFLSLLKNPFCRCGEDTFDFRKNVRDYETYILRKKDDNPHDDLISWAENIKNKFTPLGDFLKQEKVALTDLIKTHLKIAEDIAGSDNQDGADILWKGESGRVCAGFFADLLEYADIIGMIKPEDYLDFIENMMSGVTVRKQYGTHPRLKIMGPLEARLNNYDLVIVAEANEGTWPQTSSADPWMSKSMKQKFGLPVPEKKVGVFAFDFANLLSQRNVYITRANRVGSAPSNKSRWWLRMETVLNAAGKKSEDISEQEYAVWAKLLDRRGKKQRISAPKPCPEVNLRPRKFSASGLSALMDNPYVAYAKYILNLYPLQELEQPLNSADFGNIVHKVLEEFCNKYPAELPKNAENIMLDIGKKIFSESEIDAGKMIFWEARFKNIVKWVLEEEKKERNGLKNIISENEGSMTMKLAGGDMILTSRADRIDEYVDGSVRIIDYKTGSNVPSEKAVEAYKAPQLLLEGLIARNGGFPKIGSKNVEELKYWKLGEKVIKISDKVDDLLNCGEQKIKEILQRYEFADMPYVFNPAPKYCKNKDYDHLARIAEWGVNAKNEEDEFDE